MGGSSSALLESSSSSSFLVLLVSIVSILSTSIVLLLCYLFIACSLRPRHSQSATPLSTTADHQGRPRRGLEEAIIRRIPTLRYHQHNDDDKQQQQHCAVCLADFREGERLRRLPPCLHSFHIDCIDAWLAAALTCPLCRAHVDIAAFFPSAAAASATATATSTTRQPDDDDEALLAGVHQPMRRSLSLDSCADKNLYLALRTIVLQQQSQQLCSTLLGDPQVSKGEGSSGAGVSGGRLRRSFFSFSFTHGRSSPPPILPI